MWNDTDTPLAVLITFRCRGTWLHGDERGSVDRRNNQFGAPRLPENPRLHRYESKIARTDPVYLDAARRASVIRAIKETCEIREWPLLACNVRTNHVHAVINSGETNGGKVMHALKSNATRCMRADNNWAEDFSPWADGGSKRYLWNENSVTQAVDYVLHRQGGELPEFE
ncbi:MAG: transposase [Pyrinomonadaceae bacterium]|nr:transposase [Pyrinomonadaceae bacterium]